MQYRKVSAFLLILILLDFVGFNPWVVTMPHLKPALSGNNIGIEQVFFFGDFLQTKLLAHLWHAAEEQPFAVQWEA